MTEDEISEAELAEGIARLREIERLLQERLPPRRRQYMSDEHAEQMARKIDAAAKRLTPTKAAELARLWYNH